MHCRAGKYCAAFSNPFVLEHNVILTFSYRSELSHLLTHLPSVISNLISIAFIKIGMHTNQKTTEQLISSAFWFPDRFQKNNNTVHFACSGKPTNCSSFNGVLYMLEVIK